MGRRIGYTFVWYVDRCLAFAESGALATEDG